jgi:hypothetical protein
MWSSIRRPATESTRAPSKNPASRACQDALRSRAVGERFSANGSTVKDEDLNHVQSEMLTFE